MKLLLQKRVFVRTIYRYHSTKHLQSHQSVQKVKGTQISYNSYCQGGRSGLIKLSNTPELCLKITEKVAFNTASEPSYVYIFEWTKSLIKNAKIEFMKNLKLKVKQCYQTGHFLQDKNWWKVPKWKNCKCDILGLFQTFCIHIA